MKNKNHFFISYTGNKRNEADYIINEIDFNNTKNIIEPFGGSGAISFHIWKKYGNKFNYYINDNSNILISFYNLFKNEELETIEQELQKIGNTINNKDDWKILFKQKEKTVYSNFLFYKYSHRSTPGFYPLNRNFKKLTLNFNTEQKLFIDFIKLSNVFITNNDWFEIFETHKNNEESIFIFDPPYINLNNNFYLNPSLNIYQYFYDNKIEDYKSKIYFVLEDVWIIRFLFINNPILISYDKQYERSKKKTKHILITNILQTVK